MHLYIKEKEVSMQHEQPHREIQSLPIKMHLLKCTAFPLTLLISLVQGLNIPYSGISRGSEAFWSNVNDSYHKNVLYWPEPNLNPWSSRVSWMD